MNDVNVLRNNGVDLESALEYLGDMEMYDETLQEFLNSVEEKKSLLLNYKSMGDMANYAIYAHSLKSDARYLGFKALAELSLNHEMEGKNANQAFVDEHFNELMNETNRMVEVAKLYLANAPVVETPNIPASSIENEAAILVVDDSDMVRNFISRVFNNTFGVVLAGDGHQAIEELSKPNNIKGILLDLNMPNVNGFEVLDYLKQNNLFAKYPVSIITGADDKDTITKAFTYQIIDMLQKPFNERDVKRIVERTIGYGK